MDYRPIGGHSLHLRHIQFSSVGKLSSNTRLSEVIGLLKEVTFRSHRNCPLDVEGRVQMFRETIPGDCRESLYLRHVWQSFR